MSRRTLVAIAFLGAACSSNGGTKASHEEMPSSSPPAKTPESAEPAPQPTEANACERPPFLDAYGPLTTIAGTGTIRRKGDNGWTASMEGTPALDAELSRPHIAMADASGAIYVADKDAHAVRKIATDGTITTVAGTSAAGDDGDGPAVAASARLSSPNGLWVRGDGTLYILDLGSSAIRRVDTSGRMTTVLRPADGISIGRGLWVADDESKIIIASGSRIIEWTSAGVTTLADGFRQLGNLYRLANGDLLVTDRGASRVYRVTSDGAKTHIAGGGTRTDDCAPATEVDLPGVRSVWPHASGGYFLGTHSGSSVWFVDGAGYAHRFLDGLDGIDEVRALTIDGTGRLIIVDDDAGFVRTMAPPS
jgi:hypothetical protein